MTAEQLLSHCWLEGASTTPLPNSDGQLRKFNDARRLWRAAADAAMLALRAPTVTSIHHEALATPLPPRRTQSDGGAARSHSRGGAACSTGAGTTAKRQRRSTMPAEAGTSNRQRGSKEEQPALSAEALEELRAAFRVYDKDGSGEIGLAQLVEVRRTPGGGEIVRGWWGVEAGRRMPHARDRRVPQVAKQLGATHENAEETLRRFDEDGSGTST